MLALRMELRSGAPSAASVGSAALPEPGSQTPGPQNCERVNLCCSEPPSVCTLSRWPQDTDMEGEMETWRGRFPFSVDQPA